MRKILLNGVLILFLLLLQTSDVYGKENAECQCRKTIECQCPENIQFSISCPGDCKTTVAPAASGNKGEEEKCDSRCSGEQTDKKQDKVEEFKEPNIKFESGISGYVLNSKHNWGLSRLEPFVKISWPIISRRLYIYTFVMLERTTFAYKTSSASNELDLNLNLKLSSSSNPVFGYGLRPVFWSRGRYSLEGNAEMELMSLNAIEIDRVNLSVSTGEMEVKSDITDLAKEGMELMYNWQRYSAGLRFNVQLWRFKLNTMLGYTWLRTTIKIDTSEELLTNLKIGNAIPKKYVFAEESVFGSAGTEIRLFDGLYLNLLGSIVPIPDSPVYFGQISLIIAGQ